MQLRDDCNLVDVRIDVQLKAVRSPLWAGIRACAGVAKRCWRTALIALAAVEAVRTSSRHC